jgi:uncharacterized protein YjbI with pentapeptide repeats
LAHLTPEQLTAYLATLGPGSDINARGVRFSDDLLKKLLSRFRHGINATVGAADFSDAVFTDSVLFFRIFFRDKADFSRAKFDHYAHFFRAGFRADANFSNTKFSSARFSRSTFKRADFSYARFEGPAKFLCRAQELVLAEAKVSKELTLETAASTVDARNVQGSGRISMRLRVARVDLSGLVFNGSVTVHALRQPLHWEESGLVDPRIGEPSVRVVSLAGADIGRLVLTDVDLTECRFAGMQRMDELFFDGWCIFARDPRGVRQILAEEGYWRAARQSHEGKRRTARQRTPAPFEERVESNVEEYPQETSQPHWLTHQIRPRWTPAPTGTEVVSPARLQVMYRQLRKAVEDVKNEPGAADFYYGEMEMRRHARTSPWGERAVVWLYWLISGYGLRALRSLAALIILGVIIFTALTGWGLAATAPAQNLAGTISAVPGKPTRISATLTGIPAQLPPPSQRWTTQRASNAVEVTLESFVFRTAGQPLTIVGTWVTIAARILGPLLLGLALLAARNRVKR